MGVAYATNLDEALAAVHEVLGKNPRVLKEPAPVVRIVQTADSSINIAVKPWVAVSDFGPAIGEINKAIVEKFREANVEIPFPQRDIRIVGGSAA